MEVITNDAGCRKQQALWCTHEFCAEMQTYLYYLDEEATAISIRSVDESEMLA